LLEFWFCNFFLLLFSVYFYLQVTFDEPLPNDHPWHALDVCSVQSTYRPGKGASIYFDEDLETRLYSHLSLQGLSKVSRRCISGKFYKDLDIVNCFPVILQQIFLNQNIDCEELTSYVEDRKVALKEVADQLAISTDVAKRAFLTCLHVGKYKTAVTGGAVADRLESFSAEVKAGLIQLKAKPDYSTLWAQVVRKCDDKAASDAARQAVPAPPRNPNYLGSFCSFVVGQTEAKILRYLETFLNSKQDLGSTVDVLVFDGLMAREPVSGWGLNDDEVTVLLEEASDHIRGQCGFDVQLLEKPLSFSPDQVTALHGDKFDKLMPGDDVIEFDHKYNSAGIAELKYTRGLEIDTKTDVYLQSSWKTGKSYYMASVLVKNLVERKQAEKVKILVVSGRKSLSASLIGVFKAHGLNFEMLPAGILDTNKNAWVVCQVDSAMRAIPRGRQALNFKFDALVLDELNQTQAHVFGGANARGGSTQAQQGLAAVQKLLQTAGQVLVMDNDLTTHQVESIKAVRPADQASVVLKNVHQPWSDLDCHYLNRFDSFMIAELALFEELKAQQERRDRNESWKGLVAACHSIEQAKSLKQKAIELGIPEELIATYTGHTDSALKEQHFRDAKRFWEPYALVIYTSTVSVGVDCNSPHFESLYAFFSEGNIAVAQSAQMLFRCRQLKKVVIAFAGSYHLHYPDTPEGVYKWVQKAHTGLQLPQFADPALQLHLPIYVEEARLIELVQSQLVGNLWLGAVLESFRSKRAFLPRLVHLLGRAGIQCKPFAVEPYLGDLSKEQKHDLQVDRKLIKEHVRLKDWEEGLRHVSEALELSAAQVETGAHSESMKLALRVRQVLEAFHVGKGEINAAWLDHYFKFMEAFTLLKRVSTLEWKPLDLNGRPLNAGEAISPASFLKAAEPSVAVTSDTKLTGKNVTKVLKVRDEREVLEHLTTVFKLLPFLLAEATDVVVPAAELEKKDMAAYLGHLLDPDIGPRLFRSLTGRQANNYLQVLLGDQGLEIYKAARALNHVLSRVGGEIVHVKAEEDAKEKSYIFRWCWMVDAPSPLPRHPLCGRPPQVRLAPSQPPPLDFASPSQPASAPQFAPRPRVRASADSRAAKVPRSESSRPLHGDQVPPRARPEAEAEWGDEDFEDSRRSRPRKRKKALAVVPFSDEEADESGEDSW